MTRDEEIEELAQKLYVRGVPPPTACFAAAEEFLAARDRWRASRAHTATLKATPTEMEDLAADAVSALRYISTNYGEHDGVGWRRVFEKAAKLQPKHAATLKAQEAQEGSDGA